MNHTPSPSDESKLLELLVKAEAEHPRFEYKLMHCGSQEYENNYDQLSGYEFIQVVNSKKTVTERAYDVSGRPHDVAREKDCTALLFRKPLNGVYESLFQALREARNDYYTIKQDSIDVVALRANNDKLATEFMEATAKIAVLEAQLASAGIVPAAKVVHEEEAIPPF